MKTVEINETDEQKDKEVWELYCMQRDSKYRDMERNWEKKKQGAGKETDIEVMDCKLNSCQWGKMESSSQSE